MTFCLVDRSTYTDFEQVFFFITFTPNIKFIAREFASYHNGNVSDKDKHRISVH